jgi:hypothetical protein
MSCCNTCSLRLSTPSVCVNIVHVNIVHLQQLAGSSAMAPRSRHSSSVLPWGWDLQYHTDGDLHMSVLDVMNSGNMHAHDQNV